MKKKITLKRQVKLLNVRVTKIKISYIPTM